jgi:hypothetical protein
VSRAVRDPRRLVAQGWRLEVETTTPVQRSLIQQHLGARRFAYNWALAQVKANLDARGSRSLGAGPGLDAADAPQGLEPE